MTLGSKQDLDALLRGWPAPAPGKGKGVIAPEASADWDARADAIIKAALASGASRDERAIDALLEAPPLAAEPGEPSATSAGDPKKMANENEPGGPSSKDANSPPAAVPAAERKRTSLKALAERASQAGASRVPSIAPGSGPGNASFPPPVMSTATPVPPPSAMPSRPPVSRPVEASSEDSGVIDLNAVHAAATPEQKEAAEKAQPASAGLFDDESKPAREARVEQKAKVVSIADARENKKNGGMIAGAVIALLGIAAAFAIVQQNKPTAPTAAVDARPPVAAEIKAAPQAAEAPAAAPEAKPAPASDGIAIADLEDKGNESEKPAAAPQGTAAPSAGGALAGAAPINKEPSSDGRLAAAKPAQAGGKPGDLASEMARAVGADAPSKGAADEGVPEPAAGNPKGQSIPEQPSQGSVQSAIGAVMGAAKACVSGADDVSRAQVTFSSSGAVSNVSVSGWAASNGAAGCIKGALKGAKVGPFSKPSYTFGVNIRP